MDVFGVGVVLVVVLVVVAALVVAALVMASRYKIASPSEAFIITGRNCQISL